MWFTSHIGKINRDIDCKFIREETEIDVTFRKADDSRCRPIFKSFKKEFDAGACLYIA